MDQLAARAPASALSISPEEHQRVSMTVSGEAWLSRALGLGPLLPAAVQRGPERHTNRGDPLALLLTGGGPRPAAPSASGWERPHLAQQLC